MKRNISFLSVVIAGFMISSCAGETNTDNEAGDIAQEEVVKKCLYSYSPDSTKVEFIAYKFLNKTGVGGAFTEVNVKGGEENESSKAVIESLSFEIPISGLNTKDEGRDEKINEFFFGKIKTDVISGKVISIDNDKAVIEITMNGITKEVNGQYNLDDDLFTFNSEIDVLDWDAKSGIDALNKECHDLHIDHANGDKESKLWSEVSISFSTRLNKNCK